MPSIVDKYEKIFAADPRSRIFVELARALLERGDGARAIEVCRTGLEHHPSSILGRVIWGRALLAQGDLHDAQDQFEIAIALDPGSPYAYNLVGEALFTGGHFREALPVLARAAELQPGDARLRGWLEQAREKARGAGSAAEPARGSTGSPRADLPSGSPRADHEGSARPELVEGRAEQAPSAPQPDMEGSACSELVEGRAEQAPSAPQPDMEGSARPEPAERRAEQLASAHVAPPPPADEDLAEKTEPYRPLAPRAGSRTAADAPAPDAAPEGPPVLARIAPRPAATPEAPPEPRVEGDVALAVDVDAVETSWEEPPLEAPAEAPPPTPPALHRDEIPHSLLAMIPGGSRAATPAARAPAAAVPDEREAEAIAARYEQEVRDRLLAEPEPAPSAFHRHRGAFLAASAAVLLAAAGGVYLLVHARYASQAAAAASGRARAGLARDTVGSLREAARVLAEARGIAPSPELDGLAAEVAAVLATEHDDAEARALAATLAAAPDGGGGALVARYLLAAQPADRAAAEAALLNAGPDPSEPVVQALAGRILLARGQVEGGRGRLEIAARASPPLLRALSDLGDSSRAAGDLEGALASYALALSAHPTHPRSVVGAAEARLALGRDLERSRAELAAVDADPGSAPPRDLRVRYELATARLLAATGHAADAAARLQRATEKLGESPTLAAGAAEVHLAVRAWDRAEAAAARAVALAPGDVAARVLLARARIGRGKYAEAIAATGSADGRPIRLQRAIARFRMGQLAEARSELERTWKDGRMPAEAAVWYALIDVRQGRADRAQALLEKLPSPPLLASVALGQALEAQGKPAEAEAAYRAAAAQDPGAPEGHAALGQFLLAHGSAAPAEPELARAVAIDPSDLEVRRALGAARLAGGKPALARAELDAVLIARPADPEALRLLSEAWRAEGQAGEARRAAERGLSHAPSHPGLLLAAAEAALDSGDRTAARAFAQRAVKAAGRSPAGAEAAAVLARARAR